MPHIPEAELHAYLDQALTRPRCVEIESHLAECWACSATRDEIAALRDRTTALLARLGPRRVVAPPVSEIRRRAHARQRRRERILQRAGWAASVALGVGVGWTASYLVHLRPPEVAASAPVGAPVTPPMAVAPARKAPSPDSPVPLGAPARAADASTPIATGRGDTGPAERPRTTIPAAAAPAAAELASRGGAVGGTQPAPGEASASVSPDHGHAAARDSAVRIDSAATPEVAAHPGDGRRKPVTVVAQQLASGEVVRTVDGPVTDLSVLLGGRPTPESAGPQSPASPARGNALLLRHGDRMLSVTGPISNDSLRAMLRRLNLMMRVR